MSFPGLLTDAGSGLSTFVTRGVREDGVIWPGLLCEDVTLFRSLASRRVRGPLFPLRLGLVFVHLQQLRRLREGAESNSCAPPGPASLPGPCWLSPLPQTTRAACQGPLPQGPLKGHTVPWM